MNINSKHELIRNFGWLKRRLTKLPNSLTAITSTTNTLIFSVPHELAEGQIYPFYRFRAELANNGFQFQEFKLSTFTDCPSSSPSPQISRVIFQTWFDLSAATIQALAERLKIAFPNAELIYLDFFAPLDLRYAKALDPYLMHYVKKQRFVDFSQYWQSTSGDTNLTNYYSERFSLDLPLTNFGVPTHFEEKLRVGTNFCMYPSLVRRFLDPFPAWAKKAKSKKSIDLHARMATQGEPWYQAMRTEARTAVASLQGIQLAFNGTVNKRQYLNELRASRVCFSPFGYGEVCWRDYEAIAMGAVLLKPDMNHLAVSPNIFCEGQTYVSIDWSLEDFQEKLQKCLASEDIQRTISLEAYSRIHSYLMSNEPLNDLLNFIR